jgi:benzylsuccinate CoA-transferase BbsE subunit
VIELASDVAAYCGKLLGDLGAEVILVEPREGHRSRGYGPFVADTPDPERSLWFWHYNTSKLGVALDLDEARDAELFGRLAASADIVVEAEPLGRLAALGLDEPDLRAAHPKLIWVSVTPFGRTNPRAAEQATDLTVLSGGGTAWSTGYDDHSLSPVRPAGNQGYQTASIWGAISALVAVLAREVSGSGQLIDVSMHAATNVTTELGSHVWMVARQTVQRQTGRHADVAETLPTLEVAADGREVNTGFPARSPKELNTVIEWLESTGLADGFADIVLLRLAAESGGIDLTKLADDPLTQECFRAARDAQALLARNMSSYEFFVESQQRGLPVGIIYSPEEVIADPHLEERGFPVKVRHDELGQEFVYPGAPSRFTASPWRISRRAPHLAEHQSLLDGLPRRDLSSQVRSR